MRRKTRNKVQAAKPGFDALMEQICIDFGLCGSVVNGVPQHVTNYIPETGIVTADQFADWVLLAEGMEPDPHSTHRDPLNTAFVRHMGSDPVPAEKLRRKNGEECDST